MGLLNSTSTQDSKSAYVWFKVDHGTFFSEHLYSRSVGL